MNAEKREVRTISCDLAIREKEGTAPGESRTIAGTAIVFNSDSEILDDWGYRFKERILPEACSAEFLSRMDIKLNLLHERELTLARSNKGKGNLRLNVTDKGVDFEFDAPKCDLGDRALELVRAGVYSGCSFEFYPKDYIVEENDKETTITHKEFEAITALTIGMDPAYKATSVNVEREREKIEKKKEKKVNAPVSFYERERKLNIMEKEIETLIN